MKAWVKDMVKLKLQESKSDSELAKILDEAREYAQVYVLARQRQKAATTWVNWRP